LPVPVSPSSSTVESVAAARSSSAKVVRIAIDVPNSAPKWSLSAIGSDRVRVASWKRTATRPRLSTLPSRR
jgi:hypothetical protein